jgi:hypothetical protein
VEEKKGVSSQNRANLQAAAEQRIEVMKVEAVEHRTRKNLKKTRILKPHGKDAYDGKDRLRGSNNG